VWEAEDSVGSTVGSGLKFIFGAVIHIFFLHIAQDWSAMVYFYGPMLLIVVFNTIMFILTVIYFVKTRSEYLKRKQKPIKAKYM